MAVLQSWYDGVVQLLWHKSMIKVVELTGDGPSMDELSKVRIVFADTTILHLLLFLMVSVHH